MLWPRTALWTPCEQTRPSRAPSSAPGSKVSGWAGGRERDRAEQGAETGGRHGAVAGVTLVLILLVLYKHRPRRAEQVFASAIPPASTIQSINIIIITASRAEAGKRSPGPRRFTSMCKHPPSNHWPSRNRFPTPAHVARAQGCLCFTKTLYSLPYSPHILFTWDDFD